MYPPPIFPVHAGVFSVTLYSLVRLLYCVKRYMNCDWDQIRMLDVPGTVQFASLHLVGLVSVWPTLCDSMKMISQYMKLCLNEKLE